RSTRDWSADVCSSDLSRSRTRTQEPAWDIKVTHVVFNHTFKPDADGPATGDALSIRIDWDNELQHGPRTIPGGDEYGGGEWIVKVGRAACREGEQGCE